MNETNIALANITDAGLFERLASDVLRFAEPEIYKSISRMIEDHARVLKCISLKPNVALSSGKFVLNFGSAEGINLKDLIIAREENGREIFLEISTLNKHDAILELISSVDDIQSINVDNVKILSGA